MLIMILTPSFPKNNFLPLTIVMSGWAHGLTPSPVTVMSVSEAGGVCPSFPGFILSISISDQSWEKISIYPLKPWQPSSPSRGLVTSGQQRTALT